MSTPRPFNALSLLDAGKRPGNPTAPKAQTPGQRRATFARSDTEELRVELASYEGHPFVNLRIWFTGTDGQWHPTKKGCTVRLREVPELVAALEALGSGNGQ